MLVEGATLHTCHGEDKPAIARMPLERLDFSKIEGGETGVEIKLQLDAVAGLTISQSGKLLRVPKQKFDLKAQGVQPVDIGWRLVYISREQHDKAGIFGIAAVE